MSVPPSSIPFNFGGLGKEVATFERARFVVLPIPYDMTASYQSGMRRGPMAIIDASAHMELYDEELGKETSSVGIHTLPFLEPTTLGPKEMVDIVLEASRPILKADKTPVLLGGEHSVTFGVVKALKERYEELSVLHLDAHADMRDSYQGSPFNHACVGRRTSEVCPIVQVGIRSLSHEEANFLRQSDGIYTYFAKDIIDGIPVNDICNNLTEDVFITIDLDIFDPSIMPAVGTPEPGGLGWYGVLNLLRAVAVRKRVVGFDVVELCPIPGNIAPDFMAARLVYKMMGYVSQKDL